LLIDDIDAELDRGRIEALLSELEGRAQTFISTSRRAIAARYRDRARVYLVTNGRAVWEGGPGAEAPGAEAPEGELERAVREMVLDEENEHNAAF
jgi:hypothetical protein